MATSWVGAATTIWSRSLGRQKDGGFQWGSLMAAVPARTWMDGLRHGTCYSREAAQLQRGWQCCLGSCSCSPLSKEHRAGVGQQLQEWSPPLPHRCPLPTCLTGSLLLLLLPLLRKASSLSQLEAGEPHWSAALWIEKYCIF